MKNILIALFLLVMTIACNDDVRKATNAAVSSPTSVEINLEVIELAKQGKSIEALKKGEEFLRSGSDTEGVLHSTLARIYADLGDTESSVRHMQKVNRAADNSQVTAIVSRNEPPATTPGPAIQPSVSTGGGGMAGGASAVIGPNGIEVRAGSASANVRN